MIIAYNSFNFLRGLDVFSLSWNRKYNTARPLNPYRQAKKK